ncbi:MAG: LytTR family DNA-binding domain-containing protein [Bacteroidota bacterium]|nr:LytTR family DNA-binding domain-containing protein [Bacteroidota bacterium]
MGKENKIKTLIIDDEKPARDLVRFYLLKEPGIEISGEFADGFTGLKGIRELHPDLIFLDIQMPRLNGFEMLELLEEPVQVIFITAFDEYAIRAFERNAIDYLLKPYSSERFSQAVQKAREKISGRETVGNDVSKVIHTLDEDPYLLERIAVKTGQKIQVIPVSDILFIEADGDYVNIHVQGSSFLKEKTMKYFESHLDPSQFIRIHRSVIVNAGFINRIELYDKESYIVFLKDDTRLKASISGYRVLKERLRI